MDGSQAHGLARHQPEAPKRLRASHGLPSRNGSRDERARKLRSHTRLNKHIVRKSAVGQIEEGYARSPLDVGAHARPCRYRSSALIDQPSRLAQCECSGELPRVKKAIGELMPMNRPTVRFGDRIAADEQRRRGTLSIHRLPADSDVQALVSRVCVARVHSSGRRSLPRQLLCAILSQPSVR